MSGEFACGVCGSDFGNAGALAAHTNLSRDAAHRAKVAAMAQAQNASEPTPNPTATSATANVLAESQDTRAVQLPKAPDVGPLLTGKEGSLAKPTQPTGQPIGPPTDALELLVLNSVPVLVNGLVLRGPNDGKLTVDEVQASGLAKAVTACLEHYLPQIPADHPLTALIVSGAALGFIVVAKKGAGPKAPEQSRPTAPAVEPATEQPMPPPQPVQGTGDPYWDSILADAQGGAVDAED